MHVCLPVLGLLLLWMIPRCAGDDAGIRNGSGKTIECFGPMQERWGLSRSVLDVKFSPCHASRRLPPPTDSPLSLPRSINSPGQQPPRSSLRDAHISHFIWAIGLDCSITPAQPSRIGSTTALLPLQIRCAVASRRSPLHQRRFPLEFIRTGTTSHPDHPCHPLL